ncbi:breast cancer anti-estrogen resistance protein 3 homolog [Drosophila novamexicana]|uniref:breast cancer anti-estrogen resistance protein 3 homolog n=1 Tax=Drosophila novamexicana TaxID=47314 RepID=UPI0011E5A050|nr:breast cancer anti-estrogen resistance protein 3 homolog [Drosophila novamexicana]XP_030555937.1 breast cancer anti-estrogen resistance protein 3 homolog [Drosophila novamexicana]XP_030555938.1 breast cancer anti-estrogen resistance protein 3 homolog [Drosophila novamexicana]
MGNVQTRQLESRNATNRRSSILWNFRYPQATRRRDDVAMIIHNSRLSIGEWLNLLELQQYEGNLKMYATVNDVGDITDRDLKRLGIRSMSHRQKMLNSLLGVRAKRRQSMNLEALRSAPCAVPRRKSSCPMVYLDADNMAGSNDSGGAAVITTKSGKVLKQLTFDETTTIYEELRPRSKCNSPHWDNNADDMESGNNSNVSTPIAASPNPNEQQEAIALKKALEWELSLDARELRSHAWYHGALPRQRAEEIVQREGDFLVRDCASQPDNYVLTCRSKSAVLHFVLNKLVLQPETVYERVQYQFEEDAFDTVPDLITFYVGSGKPISAASGALIQYPCNRTYPLSFYGHKIVGNQLHTQMLAGLRGLSPLNSPMGSSSAGGSAIFRFGQLAGDVPAQQQATVPAATPASPHCSPPRVRREVPPPRLPCKKQQRSQSLTPAQAMVVCNINKQQEQQQQQQLAAADATNGHGLARFQTIARCNPTIDMQLQSQQLEHKFSTQSLPRPSTSAAQALRQQAAARICNLARNFSLDTPDRAPSPPPKPRKEPMAAVLAYQASGSDSGNGSGDSAPGDVSELSIQRGGVIIKNPRYMSSSASNGTLKSFTEFDALAAEEQLFTLPIEEFKLSSKFDFENFSTLLLPSVENKPLDGDALNTFKMMLLETGPKLLAEHITRIDIGLFLDEPENESDCYLSCSGLELLTLPHGKVFREDLIERTQCIKLMVAVTILTCQTDLDRAELLSKWIQIAVETKTALGNLFGFCAIMLGLCMQQIQKLDQAWHILRQKYTDSAFTFEAKLRPTLSSMNEASNPQAPNTTVPHVLLYALLIDRPVLDIINHSNVDERPALYNTCIAPWETKADDFGMSINFQHLDASRGFLKNLDLYRKNAKIIMEEASTRLDELLADAFRTEFHVKFLWGSSGATAKPEDRHGKLEKVLTLMADKFCSVSA